MGLSGAWRLDAPIPDVAAIEEAWGGSPFGALQLEASDLVSWDSALLVYLARVRRWCSQRQVALDTAALPAGLRRLLELSTRKPVQAQAPEAAACSRLAALGHQALHIWHEIVSILSFFGETTLSVARLLSGRAYFRRLDFALAVRQCGPNALGIVATISVLVGMILAFVGATELRMFGAEIYVANLVGTGMTLEMGALMTGIILAGRTGAAFAAQLGSMQVNEEIDALQTFGVSISDYLVLPRLAALVLMTPLLVVYADIMGIGGGMLVGTCMLGVSPRVFLHQALSQVTLWICAQGLIKGTSFGIVVALAGCLRGMRCGRSASAVGEAATDAVVTAIVWIVVTDAVWTFIFMVT